MALTREEKKTFKIRRGLDHEERPAADVEVHPDGGPGKQVTVPLSPDADKWLTEIERRAEEEGSFVEPDPDAADTAKMTFARVFPDPFDYED